MRRSSAVHRLMQYIGLPLTTGLGIKLQIGEVNINLYRLAGFRNFSTLETDL